MSDAGVFSGSSLNCKIEEGALGLPNPDPLPNDDLDTPYFFVGDDAFALRPNMIKPYSHRYLAHDERIWFQLQNLGEWWKMPLASWVLDSDV